MEKKSYIVGVDIGSSNVVVVVGTRNADGSLNIDGIASRPVAGGVTSGRIGNVRSVGAAIRGAKEELEEELGIRINEAYAGISGNFIRCASYTDHVFIKDSSRCITKEDVAALHERMRNVLADDGEQIMDRIPQNYVVDDGSETDDPVGAFGRKLSSTFLFILCSREQIERVKMAFHNANLRLLDICVNPAVSPEVLLSDEERDEGAAVIDIGGGTTDVSIVRGGKLRYVASVPIGASTIDDDLHAFGIAKINAEQMKKKFGSAVADMVSPDISVPIQMPGQTKKDFLQVNLVKIIEARLKDIAEFAWDEIRSAKFASRIPCGIVLTGGSALLENIDELFRRETGANVRLGAARYGIDEESQQKIGTYAHSTAVAVLLFGSEHGFCEVTERVLVPTRPNAVAEEPLRVQKPVSPVRREQPENPTVVQPKPAVEHEETKPADADSVEQKGHDEPTTVVKKATPTPPPVEDDDDDDFGADNEKQGIVSKAARWFNKLLGDNKDNEYL